MHAPFPSLQDPVDQIIGQIDTLRKFQVIPADMYEIWTAECASSRNLNHMSSARCTKLLQDIFENTKGLDPYALTSPPCKALLDKAGKVRKKTRSSAQYNMCMCVFGGEEM